MNALARSLLLGVGLLALGTTASYAQRPSIAALQAQIATQASQITALQANNIPGLASYVSVDTSTPTKPVVRLTAANFQVVNGTGNTWLANGVGNIIAGYDDPIPGGLPALCSKTGFADQTSCVNAGGTWAVNQKTGSHTIVVGPYNRYIAAVGLVVGFDNTLAANNASVTGGVVNTASGEQSSVSGGSYNTASAVNSSVSGGIANQATGPNSSVSGGYSNAASGQSASVSGGEFNTASGQNASVSSGAYNNASGLDAGVSGGIGNQATASDSSVSGGIQNVASGTDSSVSGGYGCNTGIVLYKWAVGTTAGGCSSVHQN